MKNYFIVLAIMVQAASASAIYNQYYDPNDPPTGGASCNAQYQGNSYTGCRVTYNQTPLTVPGPTCWNANTCPPPQIVVTEAACNVCGTVAVSAWECAGWNICH